jgi:hypothetical protein
VRRCERGRGNHFATVLENEQLLYKLLLRRRPIVVYIGSDSLGWPLFVVKF